MPMVYLAGPIAGQTYAGATDWRDEAQAQLARYGIAGVSPMRSKHYLMALPEMPHTHEHPLSTQKGITTRDRNDVLRADAVLVNFTGAERVSIGTVMEIAWADAGRVPIVCIYDEKGLHDHPMIRECVGFVARNLAEAVAFIATIVGTGI